MKFRRAELNWTPANSTGQPADYEANSTLWEMGNK